MVTGHKKQPTHTFFLLKREGPAGDIQACRATNFERTYCGIPTLNEISVSRCDDLEVLGQ